MRLVVWARRRPAPVIQGPGWTPGWAAAAPRPGSGSCFPGAEPALKTEGLRGPGRPSSPWPQRPSPWIRPDLSSEGCYRLFLLEEGVWGGEVRWLG